MAVRWLARLAMGSTPRIYPCAGPGMLVAVERLFLAPALRRAETPRDAAILLIAGEMPEAAWEGVSRLHAQVPHPRATFRWDGHGDPVPSLVDLWRALMAGRESEPDNLADEPPNPWRGKGDHGQGGEGMMGGTPYGRPMAMTGEDVRDGLMLDAYTARIGPFAPMLPPGLVLEMTLQGDVIVATEVVEPPFEQPPEASAPAVCAARLLRLLGLEHDGARALRGRSPPGPGRLWAVPAGLGATHTGDDVRARLRAWLAGRDDAARAPAPGDALVGLEWHEAMLMLNSFSPDKLRRTCLAEEVA